MWAGAAGLFIEFGVEVVGEEGVWEGAVGGRGEGEVLGESGEFVVGQGWTFAAGEDEEVATGVGRGWLPIAGAGGAEEGEVEGDIIADEGCFANEGEEVGEGLFRGEAFAFEGGVVEAGEGGDGGWEGGGLADEGGVGLGGGAVLDLDGAVFEDIACGGVEAGGLKVDGYVGLVGAGAFGLCALGDEALGGFAEAGAKRLAFGGGGGEGAAHEGEAVEVNRPPGGVVDAEGEALLAVGGVDEGGTPGFEV